MSALASESGIAPGTQIPTGAKPRRRQRSEVNWWLTALLVVLSLTIFVPLYFAVVTSLKTPDQLGGTGFGLPEPRPVLDGEAARLAERCRPYYARLSEHCITGPAR